MTDTDIADKRIEQSFLAAHSDPRWTTDTWPDPTARLRRARHRHMVRSAIGTCVGLAVVAAGAVTAVTVVGGGEDRVRTVSPLQGGAAGGSGLDWLMPSDTYAAYAAAHPSPSAGPAQVPSPVPIDSEARQLQDDVAASVPDARWVRIDAADGGSAGHSVVWLYAGDGTPVAVERYRLVYPVEAGVQPGATADSSGAPAESFTSPTTWPDGTAYTVATGEAVGYSFGDGHQWSGPMVWTVTPDGWFTSWTAPVPVERLLGWARTGDEHFTAG